jgi:RNA polymerase sigma-70 factor (ECF subfamily)
MMAVAQAGELEGLFASEQARLEALARRLVWDSEDARELVQAALAQAWMQRHTVREPGAARSWLTRIVVHRSLSHLRRRRLWATLSRLLGVEPEVQSSAHEKLEQLQHRRALTLAISELSAKQAAAFTLRYLEGLSLDEVASALGCQRGTARVHLQRAVEALRERGVLS